MVIEKVELLPDVLLLAQFTIRTRVNTLYVHYIFTVYSLYIHYIFTIYSLYIHYIFTIYSLYIHYIFTILRRWDFCHIFYFMLEQL